MTSLVVQKLIHLLAWFLMVKTPAGILPPAIFLLPAGGTFAILLVLVITRFDKISLHALGVGMLMGFLIAYFVLFIHFQIDVSKDLNTHCENPIAMYFDKASRERCLTEKITKKNELANLRSPYRRNLGPLRRLSPPVSYTHLTLPTNREV